MNSIARRIGSIASTPKRFLSKKTKSTREKSTVRRKQEKYDLYDKSSMEGERERENRIRFCQRYDRTNIGSRMTRIFATFFLCAACNEREGERVSRFFFRVLTESMMKSVRIRCHKNYAK